MTTPKTSAEQYAPVEDGEGYLDTKGGVPPADEGQREIQPTARRDPRRHSESEAEAERHAAEVGGEARKQRRAKVERG